MGHHCLVVSSWCNCDLGTGTAELVGPAHKLTKNHRALVAGFDIANMDVTLICEHPKIGPHAAAMKTRLGEITSVAADRISVKATTSEKLGFTGRGEGIAAIATATLVKT